MEKRGSNHIEVMAAMVLFIGFIVAGFYFFSPSQSSRLESSTLDYAQREIEKKCLTEIVSLSVQTDKNIIIGNVFVVDVKDIPADKKMSAEKVSGEKLSSLRRGDYGYIDFDDEDVFILRFSDAIEISPEYTLALSDFPSFNENNYRIILNENEKIYSESLLNSLNKSYHENYRSLKEEFNLPSRVDFSFTVIFNNGDKIEAENEEFEPIEKFSDSKKIKLLRKDNTIDFGEIVVGIW